MKKNVNVIQIKGIRGLIIAGFVVICLGAGFIVFPGLVCMYGWNFVASKVAEVPSIGIIQGLLLWGIMIASYFAFKRDKVVVCFKTPEGLSEDELKMVFADMKKQAQEDPILQAMMKARETELQLRQVEKKEDEDKEPVSTNNNSEN